MKIKKIFTNLHKKISYKDIPYPYAKYSDKYKVIFIHIPKCAGTSLISQLDSSERTRTHTEISHYHLSCRKRFKNYFKFAITREPLDRLYSLYNYFSNGGNQNSNDILLKDKYFANHSFESFVTEHLNKDFVYAWKMLRPQYAFITMPHTGVAVDRIFRQEDYNECVQYLNSNIDKVDLKNLVINSSSNPKKITHKDLDESISNKVKEIYSEDYKLLYPDFLDL